MLGLLTLAITYLLHDNVGDSFHHLTLSHGLIRELIRRPSNYSVTINTCTIILILLSISVYRNFRFLHIDSDLIISVIFINFLWSSSLIALKFNGLHGVPPGERVNVPLTTYALEHIRRFLRSFEIQFIFDFIDYLLFKFQEIRLFHLFVLVSDDGLEWIAFFGKWFHLVIDLSICESHSIRLFDFRFRLHIFNFVRRFGWGANGLGNLCVDNTLVFLTNGLLLGKSFGSGR